MRPTMTGICALAALLATPALAQTGGQPAAARADSAPDPIQTMVGRLDL